MMITKKWRWVGIAFLGSTGAAAASAPGEPECVKAQRWVAEHRETLPTTLSEISTFTRPYRRTIYSALPREIKLKLWHEQLAYYSRASELTDEQRAFVAEVDRTLDGSFGPERADVRSWYEARARALFGTPLAGQIFANLGIATPESRAGSDGARKSSVDCNCATSSDFCDPFGQGPRCCFNGCRPLPDGCGWMWCHACDGECVCF